MRTGKSIQELAAQVSRERDEKKDFVASTAVLEYQPEGGTRGRIHFAAGGAEYNVEPTQHCLRQIGERCGIPAKYAERMTGDHRQLLADNVNYWFKKEPEKRMLRTLINGQQTARAFLSERYRPLDNAALAEAVLPRLADAGCEVLSSQITETRLYIQAATPKMELDLNALRESTGGDTRKLDPVQAGIVISNSEVGCGAIKVEPMLYRLVCFNGLITAQSIRRHHVGRSTGSELEDAAEYFTDATRELDDKAFWAKVNDVVTGVFDASKFRSLAAKFAATKDVRLPDATEAVEIVAREFRLNDGEQKSVLNHLVEGAELSLFGLVNAVTRTAEDVETYDRAVEMERCGWGVLELPQTIWGRN